MLQKVEPGKGSVVIPADIQEAGRQHGAIGRLLVKIISTTAKFNKRIAALTIERDVRISELSSEALLLAKGEEIYLTEHKSELVGNRLSLNLPHGGSVEWRLSPLKLEYDMDEEMAVALLEKHNLRDCINYHPTVSKTRLKEAIDKDPSLLKKLKGFSVEKGMTFRMRFTACKTQIKRNTDDPDSELHLHTPAERSPAQAKTASM
ncbi:MAG TPA: host-nuclease inhibitor Gam family protein [Candidatus Paceibacterota bacterium]|nr:host-nuclease inhibitor Gam family protein [Candidatus Paceibacterota bacterium]